MCAELRTREDPAHSHSGTTGSLETAREEAAWARGTPASHTCAPLMSAEAPDADERAELGSMP